MIEPQWSEMDAADIDRHNLPPEVHGGYIWGACNERRRIIDLLMDPRNRGLTKRELAELIAKGR